MHMICTLYVCTILLYVTCTYIIYVYICTYIVYTFMYIAYSRYILPWCNIHTLNVKCMRKWNRINVHRRFKIYLYVYDMYIVCIFCTYIIIICNMYISHTYIFNVYTFLMQYTENVKCICKLNWVNAPRCIFMYISCICIYVYFLYILFWCM